MTACTNNGGKARRVVTAALVGALSVGAVPAIALATGTGDVSLQFAEGGTAEGATEFSKGEVSLDFKPAFGASGTINYKTDEDGYKTVTADQLPFVVNATSIKPAGTSASVSVTPGSDFKVALYKADADGNPTGSPLSGNRVLDAGDYVITVTPLTGASYVGQTFKQVFKVVPVQIVANEPFENGEQSDQELRFTGSALDLGFQMNGEELVEGVDYTVEYTKVSDGSTSDEVVDAGTYTATLTGLGKYAGTSSTSDQFEVDPTTIDADTNCHIVVPAFESTLPKHPERVYRSNGVDKKFDVDVDPSLVNLVNATGADITTSGLHQLTVKVDQEQIDKGNIVYDNDSPITVSAVKYDVEAQLMYNGAALQDSYDVFPGQSFDVNAVKAFYNGTELKSGTMDIVNGYEASTTSGEYEVTFTYNPRGVQESGSANSNLDGKVFAVTKTVTIRVWDGKLNADEDLWVYGPEYDDDNASGTQPVAITSYAKAYDGEPLSADDFFVVNEDRTVSNQDLADGPATLPNLTAKLYDADGNEVKEALDAGEYTLKVTSDDYLLSGTTELPITISKVDLTTAEVGKLVKWNDVAGEVIFPFDGSLSFATNYDAIRALGLVWDTGVDGAAYDENGFVSDDSKGEDLVPDNVDVTVEFNDEGEWKPVASFKEVGDYRVTLSVGEDVASNYVLPEGETSVTLEFKVAAASYFKDVQPSAWYYGVVNAAYEQGYMNGSVAPKFVYVDTDDDDKVDAYVLSEMGVFNPEGVLTRAQVACVLFNASGDDLDETENGYTTTKGWVTGFEDIDGAGLGNEWFAEGVAWAAQTGVVNGHDGQFRPNDPVTREEFACMLANYAERVLGDDTVGTVGADALEGMPDAAEVSGWAAANVAWAVSKGILGNGGSVDPAGIMNRAFCAAMMVNYLNPELAGK